MAPPPTSAAARTTRGPVVRLVEGALGGSQDGREGGSQDGREGGRSPGPIPPIPVTSRRPSAADDLLGLARRSLAQAATAPTAGERYAAAHLAALRAAAAVLAARAHPDPPTGRRRGPRSVWTLVPGVFPQLAEWAAFFAAGAGKRAAAEAGIAGAVTSREADDLLRDAQTFLGLVEQLLGRTHQLLLPEQVAAGERPG